MRLTLTIAASSAFGFFAGYTIVSIAMKLAG